MTANPASCEPFAVTLQAVIRPCRREDLPTLEWFSLFAADRQLIQSTFERHQRGQAVMLVVEVNGVASGQVWIDLNRQNIDSTGVLWAVRVFPCLQNLGLGARLIAAAEEILADLGFDYAELAVEKSGEAARRFYERLDYRLPDSDQPSTTGAPPDSAASHSTPGRYILRKKLSPPRTRTTIPTGDIVLKDPSP